MKKKFKSSWLNFSLALLLVSSSATLTACQNLRIGPEAINKGKEEKANKKKQTEKTSTKSKPNKSNPTPGKDEDTQMDDDPE